VTSGGTPDFWRAFHALSAEWKSAARAAYRKFRQNPAHPSLRLERLRGDTRFWSVRVTIDCRAVAQRFGNDRWLWVWIGSHKEFDRMFPG
jgi:hypothetical protein